MTDEKEDSVLLYKSSCDECGSSDANAFYSDGHSHCFSCDNHVGKASAPKSNDEVAEGVAGDLLRGRYQDLTKRGLREDTLKKFGYMVGTMNGSPVQIAPYRDKKGRIVAQKVRFPDKEMPWVGAAKKAAQLFGQHLWGKGGRKVVVTEGEIDAMTLSQLQDNRWPVVSLPNGAAGAKRDCIKQAEWLESFDEVVLMFDMDDDGREAAEAVALALQPGKVKIASLPDPYKDANEAHQDGKGAVVLDAMWKAIPFRPDGVKTVDDLWDAALEPVLMGMQWPWPTLTKATYGMRLGELYAFGGGVGCGKTEVFKELVEHLTQSYQQKVGVLMLEEQPRHTLKVLAGKIAKKRFHIPDLKYEKQELADALGQLRDKVYLYDHFGAKDWETIKAQIRFMVQGMGIKFILLDHLTALVAGEEDERRALDKIMEEMASMAVAYEFSFFFISHLTTPKFGAPHEEGGRVFEGQFTGSRAIARWSHFMFGIERNKQEPDTPTCFRVLKDRYTGDGNGVTFGLEWVRDEGRLIECELPEEEENNYDKELKENDDF